jgi:hypothetical protein
MCTLRGDLIIELLPSNGYIRHTLLGIDMILYKFRNYDTEIGHIFGNDEDRVGYGLCSHMMFGKWNEF